MPDDTPPIIKQPTMTMTDAEIGEAFVTALNDLVHIESTMMVAHDNSKQGRTSAVEGFRYIANAIHDLRKDHVEPEITEWNEDEAA